jgi:tRNA dimethylallyltransferase
LSTNSKNNIKVVLLFGPTAAGKTDLIATLFTRGFEIINADSEQVYRGLSIGTAKPNGELLTRIPHHLIDILDPEQQFTVGDFVHAADRLARDIYTRGGIPVVSGGAAFYIRHFVFGLPAAPPSNKSVRAAVKRDLDQKGSAFLYDELQKKDPEGAMKIKPADIYRVTRALEVIRQTGKPLSSFTLSRQPRSEYAFLSIGLTLPRDDLKIRIDRRVEKMFASGLEGEIQSLLAKGYTSSSPGMRGIGYREFFPPSGTQPSRDDIKTAIKLHSLQYAKRQMTFFKSMPNTRWFHPDEIDAVRNLVEDFIGTGMDTPTKGNGP